VAVMLVIWSRPSYPPIKSLDRPETISSSAFLFSQVNLSSTAQIRVLHNEMKPGRETIVFLHGFPDNVFSFSNQMEYFGRQYNVLAPTMRGYDVASAQNISGLLTIINLSEEVVRVLDAMKVSGVLHVVGHDWGAVLAQTAAKMHPSRFKTATLLAVPHVTHWAVSSLKYPLQFVSSWYTLFFQWPWLPEWWFSRNDFAGCEWLFTSWANAIEPAPARIESVKASFRADARVVAAAIGMYRQNILPLISSQFGQALGLVQPGVEDGPVPVPTLMLNGKRDLCLLPKIFEMCNREADFPRGLSTVQVEDAGHFLHQEAPDTINQLIEKFITKK